MAYIYTQLVNCICTCRRVYLYVNSFLFLPRGYVASLRLYVFSWEGVSWKGAALEWYLLEVMEGCFLQHHKGHFLIPWEFCPKPCCPFWPCPLLPSAGAGWSGDSDVVFLTISHLGAVWETREALKPFPLSAVPCAQAFLSSWTELGLRLCFYHSFCRGICALGGGCVCSSAR